MARRHSKFGTKGSAVGAIRLRPRSERHGKPLSEVYWKEAVIKTERKVLTNPQTGELETVTTRTQLSPRRPMTPIEIEAARNGVMRALHSTTTYAQPQNKE